MLTSCVSILVKMGSSFKKAMFDENISEGLTNWVQNARRCKRVPSTNLGDNSENEGIQLTNARRRQQWSKGLLG
jgi:mlo protein